MARNKFEEQIKEKLEEREIFPSENAWNKISEQLEVSRPSKRNNYYGYGIAAGFIGILFITVLYFSVVEPAADIDIEIANSAKDSVPAINIPQIIGRQTFEEEIVDTQTKFKEEKSILKENKQITHKSQKEELANVRVQETGSEELPLALHPSEELIDAKIAEVVAQVAILESERTTASDAEIDSLLRSAQRQIIEDRIFRADRSVDATALLADVESELDTSFRDQIFEALKDGFLKVRTAVADRNK